MNRHRSRALLSVVTVFALWCPTLRAHALVERYAVIVANHRGASDDVPLHYAGTDAERVRDVLRDLGGFEPVNLTLLRDESATTVRETLIAINDRIRQHLEHPGNQAMLFVYYSGHADAEALRLGSTRLPIRELSQLIRGSAATFRIAVVDACRSGAMTRSKGGRIVPPFPLVTDESLPGQGLAFLTASAVDEDAQESDALRGSFFTHAFVSGLLGPADTNHDGQVSLDEAYRYAYAATLRATSRTAAGTQHPTFRYDFHGQGDLILTRPSAHAGERAHVHVPQGLDVLIMRGDERGEVIAEVGRAAAHRVVSVRPGRFFVRARGDEVLYEGVVSAPVGATVGVDVEQLDRVQYAQLVRKGEGGITHVHGLEVGGRVRSPLPNAETLCVGGYVGYGIDFHQVGLRARLGACTSGSDNRTVSATTNAYDIDLRAYHAWDVRPFTVELGLGGGASLFHQSFTTRGVAPSRWSTTPFVAIGAALLLDLGGAYYTLLDANLETHLMRLDDGNSPRTDVALSLRGSLGIARHF